MTNSEVKQIFDASFLDITKKLVRLEVSRMDKIEDEQKDSLFIQGYRDKIETKGAVNTTVICQFPKPLFQYIISTMHGGTSPAEEEIPLYVNEYMNIICGHAISKINNITKTKSRLSVPEFYGEEEPLDFSAERDKEQYLAYESPYGVLQVYLFIE
ncbi:MAG: chemotaxis protein CheX [Lachnospiraceae bacterium]|nr:chemotaxis protein CheX [Lachnospiraceae bacterium]